MYNKSFYFVSLLLIIANSIGNSHQNSVSSCTLNNSTVCSYENGNKACCPVKNAVCCRDSDYCCPEGFQCDTTNRRCLKDDLFMPFHLKTKPLTQNIGKEILCPDNETTCHEFQTCCLIQDAFGCCPLPNAVCCNDKIHCCPKNYVCNPDQGKCDRHIQDFGTISVDWFKKEQGKKKSQNVNTVCPGGSSECPSGSTCCQLASGDWGCCPIPNAVCCEDHLHCCPENYVCDVKDGRCNKGDVSLPFYQKIKAISRKQEIVKARIDCPGGGSDCPSDTTCCLLPSGEYGCCPLPNAVCCQDHLHCCPSGYTCDISHGRCSLGAQSIPFFKKIKSNPKIQKEDVVCPGGSSECPTGSTCCQLASGDWGCCPIPNAVCCEDHLHCCPENYVCDVKDGRCNKGDVSLPFYQKVKAIPRENKDVSSVLCPDGTCFCPNGNTCCELSDGSYGCCPLPNAVCCQDHVHCCPINTKCDMVKQACVSSTYSKIIPWFKKAPAKLIYNKFESKDPIKPLLCKDNKTECDPLKTCCQMSDDSFGCCSYTNGVCCENYCCPENTICGKKVGECLDKIEMQETKKSSIKIENIPKIKNDSDCPTNSTRCLRSIDQTYVCCPYSHGTCCGSHGYCCPKGYNCDSKNEACQLNDDPDFNNNNIQKPTILIKSIVKSIKESTLNQNSFKGHVRDIETNNPTDCADGEHYCQDGFTCCTSKLDGSYGCCPLGNAVCCSDGINCCPMGFHCSNNSTSTCYKKN